MKHLPQFLPLGYSHNGLPISIFMLKKVLHLRVNRCTYMQRFSPRNSAVWDPKILSLFFFSRDISCTTICFWYCTRSPDKMVCTSGKRIFVWRNPSAQKRASPILPPQLGVHISRVLTRYAAKKRKTEKWGRGRGKKGLSETKRDSLKLHFLPIRPAFSLLSSHKSRWWLTVCLGELGIRLGERRSLASSWFR